ncbi:glycoside hydrolase family 88 protein [uncultured Akkermansia sp.]|uniref:glycoside hydrolase family 88 protein n=1 Tax=uncultured Akkermansia sp. TaxID=512294 RepID=UPI00265D54E2|nr:glycoside hydrolase family 88 protein [uncultured Akkermansia sp.]
MFSFTSLCRPWAKGVLAPALSLLFVPQPGSGASADWKEKTIRDNLSLVARWQVEHPKKRSPLHWTYGAFYSGMAQYGLAIPEGIGLPVLRKAGEEQEWKTLKRRYHADDHAIGHAWLEMAMEDGRPAAAEKIRAVLDQVMTQPSSASLQFQTPGCQDRWSWSDALFMSPPVFVKLAAYTGDRRYLEFMDREYKAACDYLFDRKEGLFFRDSRYFTIPAANGKKMFWSRGNGWVMAGLPLLLQDMPHDWPSRPYYTALLKRLAASLKKLQSPDGSWHASLMDPEHPPLKEMSGTLFIMYGMMWGVNQGYLDAEEYLPVIRRAWKAACEAVTPEGALGWVQPIADKPGHYSGEDTEVYGAGAYLMAGCELRKWVIGRDHPQKRTVTVTNSLFMFRPNETVAVPWPRGASGNDSRLRVFDVRHGRVIPHQLADTDGDGRADTLLFQGSFRPGTVRDFWILENSSLKAAPSAEVCFSRPVPERLDDFAWENDLTAHRIYGPAIARPAPAGEGLVSSGTDVWNKRAGQPVINEFYKRGDYHRDHGKGLDMYNVGRGRGCGGIAVFRDGKPYVSGNWVSARTLYNGPVQTAFEVVYAPWGVGDGMHVAETRKVTLDAGSRFSRVRSTLAVQGADMVKAGVGLDTGKGRNKYETVMADRENGGIITAWSTPRKNDGCFGTAVIAPWLPEGRAEDAEGCTYWTREVESGKPFDWYLGAVWDKASPVKSAAGWEAEVRRVRECIRHPLQIRVR